MKKICVVTIIDNNNYGNRLQNIASNIFLHNLGYEVQSGVEIFVKETWVENSKSKSKKMLKRAIPIFIIKLRDTLLEKKKSIENERKKRIKNYTEQIIKVIPKVYLNKIQDIDSFFSNNGFDYYVIGSDQVWNPYWYTKEYEYIYFLKFTNASMKICFAPSFGVETIPDSKKSIYKDYLTSFNNLNVREQNGTNIIKELLGRNSDVIIDPTLMIDVNEWDRLTQKPQKIILDKSYILAYFLGGIPEQAMSIIKLLCKEHGFILLDMMDKTNKDVYTLNPGEFLYLIKNAQIILTDSFHASVFSFLFNKPFLVFDRQHSGSNMNGRIETLLSKFDLKRKYANSGLVNEFFECDYHNGIVILEKEKQKTIDYFRKIMNN